MGERFQIARAAELKSLGVFRQFIKSVCQQYSTIDDRFCYDLQLAVDEACTNIIQHGYAAMDPGSMILNIEVELQEVILTITDFGHAFEPSEPPAPDAQAGLEDRPTGGFGLFFIYQTMDEVSYETNIYENRLTLVKRFATSLSSSEK